MDIKNKKNLISIILYLVAIFSMLILMVLLLTVIRPGRVEGTSMYPTLKDSQIVTINILNKKPKVNDIIVYKSPEDGKKVIKRVVAVGECTVKMENGKLFVNGKDVNYKFGDKRRSFRIVYNVKKEEFFALGDNQKVSKDSGDYGPVSFKNIIGILNK